MRVLVTGSNGFLGAAVTGRLCRSRPGLSVRGLHRPGSDLGRLEALRGSCPQLELRAGNLLSPGDCAAAVADVDLILHGAAALRGAAAELFLNTVVATRNLLEAVVATARPIRVVLVSSFGVYGMAGVPEGATVTEETPLEPCPARRDVYSHAKLRQEELCWEYHRRHGVALTVVRPGVVYGPSGPAMSNRVGLRVFGIFLHLGRRNLLPLTFVENCADAVIVAGEAGAVGQAYNVVDDDLPTARHYLDRYRSEVEPMRVLSLPLPATRLLASAIEWYHRHSGGQLPAILTRYKVDSAWRSFRYDNGKLKALGWSPGVATVDGLQRTFSSLRAAGAGR